jgi:H/ACA ribonucleoprotein complex non-core subunit NAF1
MSENPLQAQSLFEAIGVKKDIDVDTSETSSYCSDDHPESG